VASCAENATLTCCLILGVHSISDVQLNRGSAPTISIVVQFDDDPLQKRIFNPSAFSNGLFCDMDLPTTEQMGREQVIHQQLVESKKAIQQSKDEQWERQNHQADAAKNERDAKRKDQLERESHLAIRANRIQEREIRALRQRDEERQRLEAATQEKQRYQEKSFLFSILDKVKSQQVLSQQEIQDLKGKRYDETLALYYDSRLLISDNLWDRIHASEYHQKIGNGERSLALIGMEFLPPNRDARTKAAFYTRRGAAYRFGGELLDAKECALAALKQQDDFYAHNLLGGIYHQLGQREQANTHFERAVALGGSAFQRFAEVLPSQSQSNPNEKDLIRRYRDQEKN